MSKGERLEREVLSFLPMALSYSRVLSFTLIELYHLSTFLFSFISIEIESEGKGGKEGKEEKRQENGNNRLVLSSSIEYSMVRVMERKKGE